MKAGQGTPLFPEPPRRLLATWWSLALLALGLSTLMAIVLVAARTPFLGLGAGFFRTALVLHVDLAVVVWFLSVAAGIWVVAAPGRRPRADACAAWGARLAVGGLFLALIAPWAGRPQPILANYVPVIDSLAFLVGLGIFLGGVLLAAAPVLPALFPEMRKGQSLWPVAAGGGLVAFIIALIVFALAWPGTTTDDVEGRVWGLGHALQNVHTLMLMAAWLLLAEPAWARAPRWRPWVRGLCALALLPALADLGLALSLAPDSADYRQGFTQVMRWLTWPAPLALAGLSAWVVARHGGWRTLADGHGLLASLLLFVLGCGVGATIRGESTAVPAHYHGTVGAVTLAYMLWGRRWAGRFGLELPTGSSAWWRWQPLIYASGIALLVVGLAWSGWLGVPRKSPHADLLSLGDSYRLAMGLAGIGGGLALVGAGTFVVFMFRAAGQRWQLRRVRMNKSVGPAGQGKEQEKVQESGRQGTTELRWRLGLLLVAALVFGGIALDRWQGSPLSGKVDPAQHAAKKRKDEIDKRFKEGVMMLHSKQYEHALTAFHRVLELAPNLPEAHVNTGFALLGMGKAKAARDFFDTATNLRPDQINAYFGLGEALKELGDNFGAMQAMETYLHRAPPDDPYRRKAESAVWELRAGLEATRPSPLKEIPTTSPHKAKQP